MIGLGSLRAVSYTRIILLIAISQLGMPSKDSFTT